ncbi:alpha-mannosidase [Streptomyces sp. Ru87]|nr:glycoside hydrolase family 38 C-terminal domain-containing protein [Streptomyces sp. Ru87]PGH46897.1 alpha-mannosidase [Streptomyces sp. Ru87]
MYKSQSRDRTLHLVGNAHIDPVWLWRWPEGLQEVRATFRSAADRLEEYPEAVFTCDSVMYLEWVERHDPQLFETIRKRVAEGRWKNIGGWWIEPDCNIPSGESFVRQALYGQRYLLEKFGAAATVGSNLDPFGHNAMLPQLLSKSGLEGYVFLRPGPHEQALPGQFFHWQSPDGSRVIAYRLPHEYGSAGQDIGGHLDKALAVMPPDEPELMVFYGVGNHGGGPTKANLDSVRRLEALGGLPRLTLSHPEAFLARVRDRADIPVHAGELQHHGPGCYSAHSGIKAWNRRAENELQRAEKWAVVAAAVAGEEQPLRELTEAWKLVLFNQFHDILAGTSIRSAYEDARDDYGRARSLAADVFNRSVQAVARRIDIPLREETMPLVVFNPHPWELHTDVEAEYGRAAVSRLADDEGTPVPLQRIRSEATLNGSRGRVAFRAAVPPLGHRVYHLLPGTAAPGDRPETGPVAAAGTTLENEHLRLTVDPGTGRLGSLLDKDTGAELMPERPGPHAVVVDDPSDTWGHRIRAYDKAVGSFRPRRIRVTEQGPVRAALRVESAYGRSTLVEEFLLSAGSRQVEIRVTVDWHEQLKLLKLRFPTALTGTTATHEIPYGHLERTPDGTEEPAQAWVDVTGTLPGGRPAGLTVVNDSKYGHDVTGGDIGVTALRSPAYAWHEPHQLDPDGIYDYLDQGRQDFRLLLLPHGGDWRAADPVRRAAEFNQPAFALLETFHDGPLAQRASHADDGGSSVLVTVLKGDEDGGGDVVVRAYESAGRPARARIALPALGGRVIESEFGPCEIKTFRVPADARRPVVETDLLERARPERSGAEGTGAGASGPEGGPEGTGPDGSGPGDSRPSATRPEGTRPGGTGTRPDGRASNGRVTGATDPEPTVPEPRVPEPRVPEQAGRKRADRGRTVRGKGARGGAARETPGGETPAAEAPGGERTGGTPGGERTGGA